MNRRHDPLVGCPCRRLHSMHCIHSEYEGHDQRAMHLVVAHTAVADSPATSKLKHKDKPTTPVKSEKKGGVHAIK
ncbi:hypothetical protein RvY_03090 [Ramazzottius varieornatus]|uniref:Uncharacterized protein n=1 Tax=Ramazzottius varieornatus TaxID=947166 RepID=A0A1D1UMQ1_RAMVA|nr:hypothetical protein RvY_03090 [Ramazzottius varieornatus]